MTMSCIGLVIQVVTRQAEQDALRRGPLRGCTERVLVLVVLLVPGEEILAVSRMPISGNRGTDRERAAQRGGTGDDQVRLRIVSEVHACLERGLRVVQPRSYVFHRSADSVEPVERDLRAAQYLDPVDVVDIQHRPLRA